MAEPAPTGSDVSAGAIALRAIASAELSRRVEKVVG
jgi:hypothetical protein